MQSEADRRQNLVDDLVTRDKQLNATFKGDITEPEPSRYVLTMETMELIVRHSVALAPGSLRVLTRRPLTLGECQWSRTC